MSFSFVKAVNAVPTRAPERLLSGTGEACGAAPCFPLASLTLTGAGTSFVGALFSSWTVVDVVRNHPLPSDKHFVHTGIWWSNTAKWLEVDMNNGRVLNSAMVAAAAAGLGSFVSSTDVDGTDWAVHSHPRGTSTEGSSDTSMAGMGMGGGGSGGSTGGGSMTGGSTMSGGMGGDGMSTYFYAKDASRSQGSLLFHSARLESPAHLAGAIILSALWSALAVIVPRLCRPIEERGVSAGHPAWMVAAGGAATSLRLGFHYGAMLLIMSFNTWIILAVLGGHAAGYCLHATHLRRVDARRAASGEPAAPGVVATLLGKVELGNECRCCAA